MQQHSSLERGSWYRSPLYNIRSLLRPFCIPGLGWCCFDLLVGGKRIQICLWKIQIYQFSETAGMVFGKYLFKHSLLWICLAIIPGYHLFVYHLQETCSSLSSLFYLTKAFGTVTKLALFFISLQWLTLLTSQT